MTFPFVVFFLAWYSCPCNNYSVSGVCCDCKPSCAHGNNADSALTEDTVQVIHVNAVDEATAGMGCEDASVGSDNEDEDDGVGIMRFEAAGPTEFSVSGISLGLTLNGEVIGNGTHEIEAGEHVLRGQFGNFTARYSII